MRAYRIPTEGGPESDGTLVWDSTTLVLVEASAAGTSGIGYTYADQATAVLVREQLAGIVVGSSLHEHAATWRAMFAKIRNLGSEGVTAMAISAVDVALWDLKARILGVPLCVLCGSARDRIPLYGSGGFTSYDERKLCDQLRGWTGSGIPRVKMKIGREPERDAHRVDAARRAIGPSAELFVDANGAYSAQQALALAREFSESHVTWFEEPVVHFDMAGLHVVREHVPAGMDVSAGEYGYQLEYFARMIEAGSVDVLQADATRCGGFSGLLAVDGLCQSTYTPLSTHCAPHLHLHAGLACKMLRHSEYFFDHVRIERMLFDGASEPVDGALFPDLSRPGLGLEFKEKDAEQYLL